MKIHTIASGSKGNCYVITDGSSSLMIECGIPFSRIRKECPVPLHVLDCCLISHEHKDHSKSTKELLKNAVTCCMSQGTINALGVQDNPYIVPLELDCVYRSDSFGVLPIQAFHDAAEPLAFLIKTPSGKMVLFATDTCYLYNRITNITHLMLECNYDPDTLDANVEKGLVHVSLKNLIIKTHFGLENVLALLEAIGCNVLEEIHIIHISDVNADRDLIEREIRSVTGVPVYVE